MKRLCILALSLVSLAGCGTATKAPEAAAAATQAPESTLAYTLAASPKNPDAKPFTKDDIAAVEKSFKTVGDYVKAVPAAWYRVDSWAEMDGITTIEFFDQKPKESSRPFLCLHSRDSIPGYTGEEAFERLAQELPKALLDARRVEIYGIDFAKTGDAITPPRGIQVGDPAQALFNAYPDYRSRGGDVLYDITVLYPQAQPAWGNTESPPPKGIADWERNPFEGFLGGRVWKENGYSVVRFVFMEPPHGWEERQADYPWASDLASRYWRLDYTVEENTVQGIEYVLQYHPG